MGISGVSGAYLAERAERKRDLRKLEMAMLKKLEDTHYARASEFASFVVAAVDGIRPAFERRYSGHALPHGPRDQHEIGFFCIVYPCSGSALHPGGLPGQDQR